MEIIKGSRLAQEAEEFKTLTTAELQDKRIEFLNIRSLISYELDRFADRKGTEWFNKAKSAYKIHGVKISIIDTIIGNRDEGKKSFYKKFYQVAKNVLPEDVFSSLYETTVAELNKILS